MIKVISFDIGGTLILREDSDEYNLKKLSSLTELNYDDVRRAYKDVFQKTKGTLESLEKLFCQKLKINPTKELDEFFKQKFSNTSVIKVNPDFLEIASYLKDKGYRIILFSNSCCLIDNCLSEEILKRVDYVFYSYDIGYTKSDEESYRLIEKTLGCTSNEILHIGDTLSSDYLKPKKYGWNTLFYGSPKEERVNYITNIKELRKKLGERL